MRLLISSQHNGTTCTIFVRGEIDLAAGPELEDAVRLAVDDPTVDAVVVDLAGVTFLDCAGVGALVGGRRYAREHDRLFDIGNAHGLALRVLSLTGILTEANRCSQVT